jgi:hypothetical protein
MLLNTLVLLLWFHSIALLYIANNHCSVMVDISNNHYQCNIEIIGIDFAVSTFAVFVVGLYNMLE